MKFSQSNTFPKIEIKSFSGKTKTKRIRKTPPSEGLSTNDVKILQRVSRRAWHLDVIFSMFGYRLGWSSLIGVVPVIGDIVNVFLSLTLIKLAYAVDGGLPPYIIAQMVGNIIIDFVLGITPILGTIAGALYKANSRNSLVLEKYLKEKAAKNVALGLYLRDDRGRLIEPNIVTGEGIGKNGGTRRQKKTAASRESELLDSSKNSIVESEYTAGFSNSNEGEYRENVPRSLNVSTGASTGASSWSDSQDSNAPRARAENERVPGAPHPRQRLYS